MPSRSLLVSFCNLPIPSSHPILCLKIPLQTNEPIQFVPVAIGYPNIIRSVTGLASGAGRVFILFWSEEKHYIAVLRQNDLSPIFYQELTDVKDGHSILVKDTNLYIVSTGTDKVLRYRLLDSELTDPEVVWRASDSDSDTHHINSIVNIGNELFVSAFGQKTGTLWSSASNGYIHNITQDIRVKEGVYHPHSLTERNGQLYYCESSTKSFCSLDSPILNLDGYTRGIGWFSDELVCITSSIGRKISKSTGLIANPFDPGKTIGKSNLVVRNIIDQGIITELDLSWFGPEIYDILVLDNDIDLIKLTRSMLQTNEAQLQTLISKKIDLEIQLDNIHNSKAWKLAQLFRKIQVWLLPENSSRERFVHSLFRGIKNANRKA